MVLNSFHVVEEGIAWNIGNGSFVRLGVNSWLGCDHRYILLVHMVLNLSKKGFHTIHSIVVYNRSSIRGEGWLSNVEAGFEGADKDMWEAYVANLRNNNICLQVCNDKLVWLFSLP